MLLVSRPKRAFPGDRECDLIATSNGTSNGNNQFVILGSRGSVMLINSLGPGLSSVNMWPCTIEGAMKHDYLLSLMNKDVHLGQRVAFVLVSFGQKPAERGEMESL